MLIVELIILVVICFVVLIVNGILFWIMLRKNELRIMLNLFVLNFVVVDIFVLFVSMLVIFINVVFSMWMFSSKVCVIFGFVIIVFFILFVSLLGLIVINRYFYIVKW